ncbi:MAG: hypothetical protein FWF03_03015, partial [Defluviitaleaceae bacterium]|nr:hypothetical protein [Defluviitaleaceae bacterium]
MRIVLRKLAAAALALCLLAPGAVNVGASEASVGIVSVASNSLMFTERTYITFTVVTNANAKFVYIEYDGLIHRVENMATDPAGFYVWTARCMLSKPQEIVVYANSVDSVHGAQTRSLKIIESFLHSVEMDNEEYHKGDTVRITVKTNEKAEHVWVRYNDGTFKKGSLKSANPDGERTWTIDIKPEGTQTVRVSANTIYSYGGAASVERDVLFSEPVATVNGLRLSRANVPEGEYVTVTITTNVAATQVWVKHDDTTTDARLTRTTKSSKTWSATIRPEKTQTLSVYANVTKSETGASKKTISL